MTGVEILTSAEVVTEVLYNWTVFWITCGITFGIIVAIAIGLWLSGDADAAIIPCFAILGIGLGMILGAVSGAVFDIPTTYETQYKVTISDEVSLNEFYEHYEVIDQDGKIFTVRERTKDAN